MKILFFTLTICLFLITRISFSQYQNVKVSIPSIISYGEESIMINPKNPNQIVIGGNAASSNSISSYYYTTNGGINWSGGYLQSTLAKPSGDPVIVVDTSGNFYYICLANWQCPAPNLDKLLCFKSTNGGINWNNGTSFAHLYPKQNDKPWVCIDWSNSIYRNNMYVTWTLFDVYFSTNSLDSSYIYFCRSTDGGANFSVPVRISKQAGNCADNSQTVEGAVPCTGPNGQIYVSWSGHSNITFDKSTDGGANWLNEDIIVTQQVGGWSYNAFPITACDISNGIYNGNIYICFADQRSGQSDRDIWLVTSTNGGNSWNNPVRVNNDPPGKNQYYPWMCIDQVTGYIWVVFCDQRNYNNTLVDVYLARSTDGGNSFQNTKISSSPFQWGWYIGDYIGISAYNNKVRPVWSRYEYSYYVSVWTAIVDTFYTIGINKIENEIPVSYKLFQNYPNPFNSTTNIRFEIPKSGNAQITVYDIQGREVSVLAHEYLNPGVYEVMYNAAGMSSGVYFYKLQSEDCSITRKMILMK